MRHLLLLILAGHVLAADAVPTPRQRDSWIAIEEAVARQDLVEGQTFEVAIDYLLSDGPAAQLVLSAHGPWIDLPDGTIETKQRHVDYPGMFRTVEVHPGRGRQVFAFTVPKLHGRDSLLWIARFSDGPGKTWPWERRLAGPPLRPADAPLSIIGTVPGNLFTYAEPVRFTVGFGSRISVGTDFTAAWRILDRNGVVAGSGRAPLTVPASGSTVVLDLPWTRKGVFGLVVAVDGLTTVETSFARIPDLAAITGGGPTAFGFHGLGNVQPDAEFDRRYAIARRLGLSTCRMFVPWKSLQPARDEWRLDGLDRALAKAREHGVAAMVCLTDPPTWAMTRRAGVHFEPFAFDEAAWSESITHMTRRFKGRLAAWEWLNEIVPGAETDPVGTYLAMVRLGRAAAKAEDPAVLSVLAGGLWPRSYRLGLLAAGIGQHIDVLPIHYGDGEAVSEALGDLTAAAAAQVEVWDDESAKGVSTWRMPQADALAKGLIQREHAMTRFPGELIAGAKRIFWFGQGSDPAGNWDYAWPDGPRPVAATLAVLAAKLHRAEPQGSFAIAGSGRFSLFAVGGKAVLVAPALGAPLSLRVGSAQIAISDDQGEELRFACLDGEGELPANALPVFVEGGELEVLRGYTAPELLVSQVSLLAGDRGSLRLRLRNRGTAALACTLATTLPEGWARAAPLAVTVPAGGTQLVAIPLAIPAGTPGGEHRLAVTCTYADPRLPRVELPWQLAVVDRAQLGNLFSDGGFEQGGAAWGAGRAKNPVEPADGFAEGLGAQVLHFKGPAGWKTVSQGRTLAPGRRYLYSAWMRVIGSDAQAGSNIDQSMLDGTTKTLHIPHVFTTANLPDWQLLSKVYQAPAGLVTVGFTPVAHGEALVDNLRLTAYEGTSWAAEAPRVSTVPVIDGRLEDWAAGCPIPLLGPGQTTILDPAWKPGSANLRGVAKLAWDDGNLYLAAWIEDDVHVARETGERASESDGLSLALHPGNRAPGEDAKAFRFDITAVPPGGSSRNTLYRPAERAGGLPSGQLAKDSSIYDLAIRRDGTRTFYELRMPWSGLGATGRLGGKLGLALQLNDNDGQGRAATITWGDGLHPAWAPSQFGVLTLVD